VWCMIIIIYLLLLLFILLHVFKGKENAAKRAIAEKALDTLSHETAVYTRSLRSPRVLSNGKSQLASQQRKRGQTTSKTLFVLLSMIKYLSFELDIKKLSIRIIQVCVCMYVYRYIYICVCVCMLVCMYVCVCSNVCVCS